MSKLLLNFTIHIISFWDLIPQYGPYSSSIDKNNNQHNDQYREKNRQQIDVVKSSVYNF